MKTKKQPVKTEYPFVPAPTETGSRESVAPETPAIRCPHCGIKFLSQRALEAHAESCEPLPPKPSEEIVLINIEKIRPSATNPRKHFPEESQRELEASLKDKGFMAMFPLIVRPILRPHQVSFDEGMGKWLVLRVLEDGETAVTPAAVCETQSEAEEVMERLGSHYELIAGERRWRGARAVGIEWVPSVVTAMSDCEALEVQLMENIQREGLSVMEEAEGYQRLLGLRNEQTGELLYTVQTLAKKVGKSDDTINRRVKLLALDDKTREAVETGVLPPRTALLIARIPDEKLRQKAAKQILHPQYEEGPLSLRKATELVQREFMKDLRDAPFAQEDAELLPVEHDAEGNRCAGGACVDCPFKVGNAQPIGNEATVKQQSNNCMNPACYDRKREAGWKKWMEKETGDNRRALTEEECEEIYQYGDQLYWNSGFVDLDEHPDGTVLKPGIEHTESWRNLVKGADVEVVVARDLNGKRHELVNKELAIEAASTINGHKIFKQAKKDKNKGFQAWPEFNREMALEKLIKEKRQAALLAAAVTLDWNSAEKLRMLVYWLLEFATTWEVCSARGWSIEDNEPEDLIIEKAQIMNAPELGGLVFEMIIKNTPGYLPEVSSSSWNLKEAREAWYKMWAKELGVNLAAADKEAEIEVDWLEAEEALENESEAFRWLGELREEADDFEWNGNNVAVDPDEGEIVFPAKMKGPKIRALVKVARSSGGWHYGLTLEVGSASHSHGAMCNETKYSTRGAAVRSALLEVLASLESHGASEKQIAHVAKLAGVKVDPGEREGSAALAALENAEVFPEALKIEWSGPTKDFEWNKFGECTNPMCWKLQFPEECGDLQLTIYAASENNRWYSGQNCDDETAGHRTWPDATFVPSSGTALKAARLALLDSIEVFNEYAHFERYGFAIERVEQYIALVDKAILADSEGAEAQAGTEETAPEPSKAPTGEPDELSDEDIDGLMEWCEGQPKKDERGRDVFNIYEIMAKLNVTYDSASKLYDRWVDWRWEKDQANQEPVEEKKPAKKSSKKGAKK